ncbi:MAG: hypothetical protein ACLFSN_03490 [Candidatus Woesearchaeota archaeon]
METKPVLIIIFIFLLVISVASASLVDKYTSITGSFTIEPEINLPEDIFDCKNDGYLNYTSTDGSEFKNQGECVSFVATHMCKDKGWDGLTTLNGTSFKNQGDCISYFKQTNKTEKIMVRGEKNNITEEENVTQDNNNTTLDEKQNTRENQNSTEKQYDPRKKQKE